MSLYFFAVNIYETERHKCKRFIDLERHKTQCGIILDNNTPICRKAVNFNHLFFILLIIKVLIC